jgi:hypothetical protein
MDRNPMKIKFCPVTIHPKWYTSGFFNPKKAQSYILIALSVCHVTVMLPVLHFLWQNRPLSETRRSDPVICEADSATPLFVRSSVRPFVRPCVRLSVRPSVCPSVCPSVRLSVRPSVRPSVRTYSLLFLFLFFGFVFRIFLPVF